MRFAIEAEISFCLTANPSTWIRLAEVAEAHAQEIVRGIYDGTIGAGSGFDLEKLSEKDKELVAALNNSLAKNPSRAREIEKVVEKTGTLRPKDAWSHFSLMGCWLGGSAGTQAKRLREHYGDVPMRDAGFRASEATMSLPIGDGTSSGVMAVHTNFYEFIPEENVEDENPPVLEAHELEVGKFYYILINIFKFIINF